MITTDVLKDAVTRLAASRVETPLLETQLLIAYVLRCSRLDLIAHPDRALSEAQRDEFEAVLDRRCAREPLAYILGHKEFFGLEIGVAPGVLVPRPETELLVEECVKHSPLLPGEGQGVRSFVVADIGTGTGAAAIALAVRLSSAIVYATDISPVALEVARANVEKHNLTERVRLLRGDLVEPLAGLQFDAIVSNPPYIPSAEIESLEPEVSLYEPREALDGGPDGLDVYRRLLPASRGLLRDGGFVAVEVGAGQAGAVAEIAREAGYGKIELARDLAKIQRVVVARR